MSKLQEDIKAFNEMYKLPVATEPSLDQLGTSPTERLIAFKNILSEELNEIDEIIVHVKTRTLPDLDILTKLADLLGDIQVYCASEMTKFGIPLDETLAIIMQSNFSKLGIDGKPIYDERGKVQKGPNYWKPEPKLARMLQPMILGPGHVAAQNLLDNHNKMIEEKATPVYGAFDPLPINT